MDDITNSRISDRVTKRFFSVPKIIFIVLGVILLAEVIYAVKVLSSPTPTPPLPKKPAVTSKALAKISLTIPKADFKAKDVIPVSVTVDTGEKAVDGMDLIIRFDPNVLEASSGGIVKGKIFDDYPASSVDSKKGIISISGISNLNNSFKGVGQFAVINLKAKSSSKTFLTIDFQKGATVDSNLVETGTSNDILEAVENLELNIR